MNTIFYISAAVAVIATLCVITSRHAVHALLHLIVSLLAVALLFYVLGAPFAAALEVIIYAGAIMVLFVFAIMMLNHSREGLEQERLWLRWPAWPGPLALGLVLAGELIYLLLGGGGTASATATPVEAQAVGAALFGPWVLAVELASLLLLGGLVGACHLARREPGGSPAPEETDA